MTNSNLQISFFGLDRQFAHYRENFMDLTEKALSTGHVLQGPPVSAFESDLAKITNRRHAVAVGSATDALAFALIASGIKPGDEVLVTSFSFFASVSPILRIGAVPRFIDIDPGTFQMDIQMLDSKVTTKTKALIAVHMFGQTLPMSEIEDFCRRHSLILIEDAAQALGASDEGRPAGNLGITSCLSFDPTKVIGSFGSAGALVTDDEKIARSARMLRYHGREAKTQLHTMLGYNSQLSSEMAAHLSFKLGLLKEWEAARSQTAAIYNMRLSVIEGLILPIVRLKSTHNWHKYVIRTDRRDDLAQFLKDNGVETKIHYNRALCDEPVIASLGIEPDGIEVPNARRITTEVLSLPVHSEMTEEEAEYVAATVQQFFIGAAET